MIPIDLTGKVAIVTGASQGIGLGIASVLAEAGCHVAGCGLSEPSGSKAIHFTEQIEKHGQEAFYKQMDIRREKDIEVFVKEVIQRFGRINILISNAGENRFTTPEECETSFWNENMSLNLKSHWLMAKACFEQLRNHRGIALMMTSNHAYATLPGCFPYNVAKAGIIGLVKALAVQWGPEVRVIGLAPGFIVTEGGDKWFQSFPDPVAKRNQIEGIHPVGRLGSVEEVGAFAAFLCSEYAGFITGVTYLIDGGRSAVMQDL